MSSGQVFIVLIVKFVSLLAGHCGGDLERFLGSLEHRLVNEADLIAVVVPAELAGGF